MKNQSWLYSDSFLKRVLAITGYSILGQLLILIFLYSSLTLIEVLL